MVGTLPAGPFGSLRLAGHDVPFYVIPFDKDGALQAPATAARLVSDVAASVADGNAAAPGVTDVIVVVHGWNTDFKGALALTRDLISRLDATIADHGTPRADFRPLVVGISWPSIVLSSSNAPAMAAAPMDDVDLDGLSVLAQEVVAPEKRGEFYELAQASDLDRDMALRLAELLAPLYAGTDNDLPDTGGSEPRGTVAAWIEAQARLAEAEGPVVVSGPSGPRLPDTGGASAAAGPQAAGLLGILDPRNVVRLATVLLMKDRAGVVGFHGVGPLVVRILGARADVRVHLVGHSYGCKASLSAVSTGLPRRVRSLLLLQPALSFLALSERRPDSSAGQAATRPPSTAPSCRSSRRGPAMTSRCTRCSRSPSAAGKTWASRTSERLGEEPAQPVRGDGRLGAPGRTRRHGPRHPAARGRCPLPPGRRRESARRRWHESHLGPRRRDQRRHRLGALQPYRQLNHGGHESPDRDERTEERAMELIREQYGLVALRLGYSQGSRSEGERRDVTCSAAQS